MDAVEAIKGFGERYSVLFGVIKAVEKAAVATETEASANRGKGLSGGFIVGTKNNSEVIWSEQRSI